MYPNVEFDKIILQLHGTLSVVKCLKCSYEILRHTFQNVLTHLNPHLAVIPKEDIVRPDGDVELRLLEIIRLKKLAPTTLSVGL